MRKNKLRKSDLVILALRCSQLETSPVLRSVDAKTSSTAVGVSSDAVGVSSDAAEISSYVAGVSSGAAEISSSVAGVSSGAAEISSNVARVSSDAAEGNKLPCEDCPFKNNVGCVDLLMAELAQTLWRTLPACTRK